MADFGTANAGILAQTYLQKQELRQDALLRGGALMLQASDSYRRNKREDAAAGREQEEYEYGKTQRKTTEERAAAEEQRKADEHAAKYGARSVDDDGDPGTPEIMMSPESEKATQEAVRSRILTTKLRDARIGGTTIAALEEAMRSPDAASKNLGDAAVFDAIDVPGDAPHQGTPIVEEEGTSPWGTVKRFLSPTQSELPRKSY